MPAFPWLSAKRIRLGGIEVDALRVSYVGEPGFELHHDIEHQARLLRQLSQAGESFDARLLRRLRDERDAPGKGLPRLGYGSDHRAHAAGGRT